MNHDEMMAQGTDYGRKHCYSCGIDYEGECPSCNPRALYHVEIAEADGEADFVMRDCECGCSDFWDKKEAIHHARSLIENEETMVRVVDDNGRTIWEN